MRILVLGSDGFVGSNAKAVLETAHEVICSTRETNSQYFADLEEISTITKLLENVEPEVVINCAGVVDTRQDTTLNAQFTGNLIEAIKSINLRLHKIVVIGSAAEYGTVGSNDFPISEDTPLNANTGYGLSKLKETKLALELGSKYHLPVVIARIFNAVGPGMNPKFLIPALIRQVIDIEAGNKGALEVSNLSAERDYVHVDDVSVAIKALVENNLKANVYNIGSGVSMTNSQIVELIVKTSKLESMPELIETRPGTEPLVASQADISRITNELGWSPQYSVAQAIKEIFYAARQ